MKRQLQPYDLKQQSVQERTYANSTVASWVPMFLYIYVLFPEKTKDFNWFLGFIQPCAIQRTRISRIVEDQRIIPLFQN